MSLYPNQINPDPLKYSVCVQLVCVCVFSTDLSFLIEEEVNHAETESNKDQKREGVQHRNRTAFTAEQSTALEQGDL